MTLQKTDLIKRVAQATDISQETAAKIVNEILDTIVATLKAGDKVTLTGFGTFEVREAKARTGTNPRTKEKIQIAARKRVVFSPGTGLREAVKGEKK